MGASTELHQNVSKLRNLEMQEKPTLLSDVTGILTPSIHILKIKLLCCVCKILCTPIMLVKFFKRYICHH